MAETEEKNKTNTRPKKKNKNYSAPKGLATLGDYFKNTPEFSALYNKLNKHKHYSKKFWPPVVRIIRKMTIKATTSKFDSIEHFIDVTNIICNQRIKQFQKSWKLMQKSWISSIEENIVKE